MGCASHVKLLRSLALIFLACVATCSWIGASEEVVVSPSGDVEQVAVEDQADLNADIWFNSSVVTEVKSNLKHVRIYSVQGMRVVVMDTLPLVEPHLNFRVLQDCSQWDKERNKLEKTHKIGSSWKCPASSGMASPEGAHLGRAYKSSDLLNKGLDKAWGINVAATCSPEMRGNGMVSFMRLFNSTHIADNMNSATDKTVFKSRAYLLIHTFLHEKWEPKWQGHVEIADVPVASPGKTRVRNRFPVALRIAPMPDRTLIMDARLFARSALSSSKARPLNRTMELHPAGHKTIVGNKVHRFKGWRLSLDTVIACDIDENSRKVVSEAILHPTAKKTGMLVG